MVENKIRGVAGADVALLSQIYYLRRFFEVKRVGV